MPIAVAIGWEPSLAFTGGSPVPKGISEYDVMGSIRGEPVDLVTGPGNIYVTAAKRLLKGRIGIDSEAGPTEIAILADDSATPAFVAADLISQAEHDVVAASVLVTTSERLADEVQALLPQRIAETKHSERVAEALRGPQSGIILVRDEAHGLDVVIGATGGYLVEIGRAHV